MLKKAITFIVLLLLVYGIMEFDAGNPYSADNIFSYIGFAIFIVYLVYSVKEASKKQNQDHDFY
ncbi:hypothetical protein [Flavobacterium sp. JP2137]|uniref:hypothetical protein n=1 Tax=Flavobacterium sp. JP2137 TaxID=3414510 RepID=UPI003D2FBD7B